MDEHRLSDILHASQREQVLANSEGYAGWSRNRVQQLNNQNDGFSYSCLLYTSRIVAGFIADTSIIHPGNGLCGSLPGKVIVEITVDDRIFL